MKRQNILILSILLSSVVVFVLTTLVPGRSQAFSADGTTSANEPGVDVFDPHIRTFPAKLSERAQKALDALNADVRKVAVTDTEYITIDDGGVYQRRFIGCLGGSGSHVTDFRNITFDISDFTYFNFLHSNFIGCSFQSVVFTSCYGASIHFDPTCDLTDAFFRVCSGFTLSGEQFRATLNYQRQYLNTFWNDSRSALRDVDFTDFTLKRVGVIDAKTCSFANADITDCCLEDVTLAKLSESRSFQRRTLIGNEYYSSEAQRSGKPLDFSGADFSRFNFTNSRFGYNLDGERPEVDFTGANFEGAIITNCTFCKAVGLTLEQMKSTWDWKHGRIKTVTFSKDFAKLVEEELAKEAAERSDD